ncbi:hypothetical protein D3C73_1611380 [compost metagenome]
MFSSECFQIIHQPVPGHMSRTDRKPCLIGILLDQLRINLADTGNLHRLIADIFQFLKSCP